MATASDRDAPSQRRRSESDVIPAEYALVTDPLGRISGDAQINHFRAGLCVMGRGTPAIPAAQSLISVQFRKSTFLVRQGQRCGLLGECQEAA